MALWVCAACTLENASELLNCFACGGRKTIPTPQLLLAAEDGLSNTLQDPQSPSKKRKVDKGEEVSGSTNGIHRDDKGEHVKLGIPEEIFGKNFAGTIIRASDHDDVVKVRVEAKLKEHGEHKLWPTIQSFLDECKLSETETLNGIASSGACQFSSLAHQLWERHADNHWRPDVHMRRLALEVVRIWHERFQEFFIDPANNLTRQANTGGGAAVDVDDWLVKMSYLKTDGDHITAQALADCLKCAVNVVKWSAPGKISLIKDIRPRHIPSGGLSCGFLSFSPL